MADKAPLFTVFTPTYNRAGILHRAYKSLRGQTWRNFEWLVIDDGSTDNTREVVKGWQKEADFPIRYAWQENGNKAAAWNHALKLARGEFFVCLDSDDECVPEALESFKNHWESIPVAERDRFSGITVLALDQDGSPYGPDVPRSPMDCSPLLLTLRLRVACETWQCYRSEVIKRYPFKLIPGYRNYLPQSVGINRVAASYIQRHVNHRLLIVHTDNQGDTAGHLSCGLSARASLRHAPGYRVAHLSLLKYQMKWFRYAPVRFYKAAANFIRFSWMQGISVWDQLAELGSMRARALWLAAVPVGVVLRLNDWRIERKESA